MRISLRDSSLWFNALTPSTPLDPKTPAFSKPYTYNKKMNNTPNEENMSVINLVETVMSAEKTDPK